ncbi:MAG: prolyl oligopeptidase family serine peptidase [Flavobacteriaceae bacterium]|nr:prolyl oligopeptidase family serine peptidase [Flavobacteriaceae bacterium]
MIKYLLALLLVASGTQFIQSQEIELKTIMQDPSWIGVSPSLVGWDEQGEHLLFSDRHETSSTDSLYQINIKTSEIKKIHRNKAFVASQEKHLYNAKRSKRVHTFQNQLQIYHIKKGKTETLLELPNAIHQAKFLNDDELIFRMQNNVFVYQLKQGKLKQLTSIKTGNKNGAKKEKNAQEEWLEKENLKLLTEVNKQKQEEKNQKQARQKAQSNTYEFYLGDWNLRDLSTASNKESAYLVLQKSGQANPTKVPNYIDASGYTENLNTRPKVGQANSTYQLHYYDFQKDTVQEIELDLPGKDQLPKFTEDYPDKDWSNWQRRLSYSAPTYNDQGNLAIMDVRSADNKHRWIVLLNGNQAEVLDHQEDEAWIGGPGINSYGGSGVLGWLPNQEEVYFQSEASGYSHLHTVNVNSKEKKQLTQGNFEVFDPQVSANGKFWYFTSSEEHPGVRHFYKMPIKGGEALQITNLRGSNLGQLSPDEKQLAINYSSATSPWEIYLQKNSASAEAKPLTQGTSEAFNLLHFSSPEFITFQNRDLEEVHARLYLPEPKIKNNAAVVFVHGAGYLQNAHQWWSSYFREFMFHQKLVREGYTVIDLDYNASAGYGRDWRTSIYRHMGGKDLNDHVDAVQFLVEEHQVDPQKVGIYGGSYGGFITLMAMFNEPEVFQAGAALRAVTDWAHYNHPYTSNILNEPTQDPKAYQKSSPIYFAEGLQGHLLIAHGVVDTNVHFQDVVRLSQRLIELEKDNWEMALYPIENHGFTTASAWLDEYKRIYKLFNKVLLNKE